MRGEYYARIETALAELWQAAADSVPDWLPMRYVSWLRAAYEVCGRFTSLETLYATMLHEMGHALGLGGHSPVAADVMYRRVVESSRAGLTERDRATLRALYARPNGHRVTGPKRAD
jgi:hypothetical protein